MDPPSPQSSGGGSVLRAPRRTASFPSFMLGRGGLPSVAWEARVARDQVKVRPSKVDLGEADQHEDKVEQGEGHAHP